MKHPRGTQLLMIWQVWHLQINLWGPWESRHIFFPDKLWWKPRRHNWSSPTASRRVWRCIFSVSVSILSPRVLWCSASGRWSDWWPCKLLKSSRPKRPIERSWCFSSIQIARRLPSIRAAAPYNYMRAFCFYCNPTDYSGWRFLYFFTVFLCLPTFFTFRKETPCGTSIKGYSLHSRYHLDAKLRGKTFFLSSRSPQRPSNTSLPCRFLVAPNLKTLQ